VVACETIAADHKDSLAQQTHKNIIGQQVKDETVNSLQRRKYEGKVEIY
jgi:hypothetical protein